MSEPIIWWPDQQPLKVEIGVWDTATQTRVWHDVSGYMTIPEGGRITTSPAQGGTAEGTLNLQVPIAEDTFGFEAWNGVRISGTVAGPPVGGYPRHFRGYALKRDSQTVGLENHYSFQLVDGTYRAAKSPASLVSERTFRGSDQQIIHSMAYNCWPDLYPSGAATPTAPVTAPTVTANATGGTLTAGKWRVAYAWSNPSGPTALSNTAIPFISTGVTTGSLTVTIPGTLPAGATGAQIYVAAAADALDKVWYADVAGPGTYTITAPPTGAVPPDVAILPYPTAPTTDQPNVNNYSSVQTPSYGNLSVKVKAVTLAGALDAVRKAVPADYEAPRWMVWWTPDNAAHTATWDWKLTWLRDTDMAVYGIVAINVNYTQPEDSTHSFYYSMTRSRDGGTVGNVQTVEGDWIAASGRYATATVSSSVSYSEIGEYVSNPPVIDRSLKTDADCAARARQLLDVTKLVSETLSNVETNIPYPLLGATRIRVRNLYEGGMDQTVEADLPVYTIARAEATLTDAGLIYNLQLGDGFLELGDLRQNFRGGSGTTTSTAPPAVPQWHELPDDDNVSNSYDPTSHLSTLIVKWLPDVTGLVTQYEPRWTWDGGATWTNGSPVPPNNPPTLTLVGAPGAAVAVQVRARNANDIASDWSVSRAFTMAPREQPGAPVWVTGYTTATESATLGNATLTWTDGAGGSGTPVRWVVTVAPHSGGSQMKFSVAVRSIILHALLIGTTYDVTVQAYTVYDDPGVVSAIKQIVVPQDAPGAPATVTVTGTRTGPGTGQANLSWTAGTGGTGTINTYEARYYATASGSSTAVIVGTNNDTRLLTIPGLAVGTQYTFQVRSISVYGIPGPWSTSAPTLTLGAQNPPAPVSLTVLDYDPGSTGQSAWILLGWTPGSGGSGTVATWNIRVDWTESSTGIVRKWHKDGIPASDTSAILSPLTAGPSYTITMWAVTNWGDLSSAATLVYSITPTLTSGLYNGSFEKADPSNLTQADGFTYSVTGGTGSAVRDNSTSADGQWSQKYTAATLSGGFSSLQLLSRAFLIPGGQPYAVYYSLRSSRTDTAVFLSLIWYDRTGAPIGTAGTVSPGAPTVINTWEKQSGQALPAAPAGAVSAVLQIVVRLTTVGATAQIDGFDVRPANSTIDYTDASITTAKLAAGAVDSAALGTGAINDKAKFGSALAPIQKGTSNPASPSTDDRIWRSDVDRDLYYDGTRWVTTDVHDMPIPSAYVFSPNTTSGATVARGGIIGDTDILLVRWSVSYFIGTTNNASNYWTFQLRYVSVSNVITNLATLTTSAKSPNTWDRVAGATFSPVTVPASNTSTFEIIATKTGTPGDTYVVPMISYREIIS